MCVGTVSLSLAQTPRTGISGSNKTAGITGGAAGGLGSSTGSSIGTTQIGTNARTGTNSTANTNAGAQTAAARALGLRQLGRVRHALGWLGRLDRAAVRECLYGVGQQTGTELREVSLHFNACLVRADRPGDGREHRARIQLLDHSHDRHARLGVAGDDGTVDGRCTAPPGENRSVHVDHAQARDGEQRVWEEPPVSRYHAEIRSQSPRLEGRPRPAGAPAAEQGLHARAPLLW